MTEETTRDEPLGPEELEADKVAMVLDSRERRQPEERKLAREDGNRHTAVGAV